MATLDLIAIYEIFSIWNKFYNFLINSPLEVQYWRLIGILQN
jgi:hypothetical protein